MTVIVSAYRRAPRRDKLIAKLVALVVVAVLAAATASILLINTKASNASHTADQAKKATEQAQAAIDLAQKLANDAHNQAKAACSTYQLIGNTSPSAHSTPVGLELLASMRIAFKLAECDGDLKTADPQLKAYLPPGFN